MSQKSEPDQACVAHVCRLLHPPEESLLLGSALAMLRNNNRRSLRDWAKQLGGIYAISILIWHVRVLLMP